MTENQTEGRDESRPLTLKDSLVAHNNMFWTSATDFHLGGILDKAYQNPARRKLILRWLDGAEEKKIIIRQSDFPADPFLVRIRKDGWTASLLEEPDTSRADVELVSTHMALLIYTDTLASFLLGLLTRNLRLPIFFHKLRDHYYAMRIFFRRMR